MISLCDFLLARETPFHFPKETHARILDLENVKDSAPCLKDDLSGHWVLFTPCMLLEQKHSSVFREKVVCCVCQETSGSISETVVIYCLPL